MLTECQSLNRIHTARKQLTLHSLTHSLTKADLAQAPGLQPRSPEPRAQRPALAGAAGPEPWRVGLHAYTPLGDLRKLTPGSILVQSMLSSSGVRSTVSWNSLIDMMSWLSTGQTGSHLRTWPTALPKGKLLPPPHKGLPRESGFLPSRLLS